MVVRDRLGEMDNFFFVKKGLEKFGISAVIHFLASLVVDQFLDIFCFYKLS